MQAPPLILPGWDTSVPEELAAARTRMQERLSALVNHFAQQNGLHVECLWEDDDGTRPAAAWYEPLHERVTLDMTVGLEGKSPKGLNPLTGVGRRRVPVLIGLCAHEAAHARFTRWPTDDRGWAASGATAQTLRVAELLEEPRAEGRQVRAFPALRPYLRATMNILGLAQGLEAAMEGGERGVWAAARVAVLVMGRVDAGVLSRKDVSEVERVLRGVLGEDYERLEALWREALGVPDGDLPGLLAVARKWIGVLGEPAPGDLSGIGDMVADEERWGRGDDRKDAPGREDERGEESTAGDGGDGEDEDWEFADDGGGGEAGGGEDDAEGGDGAQERDGEGQGSDAGDGESPRGESDTDTTNDGPSDGGSQGGEDGPDDAEDASAEGDGTSSGSRGRQDDGEDDPDAEGGDTGGGGDSQDDRDPADADAQEDSQADGGDAADGDAPEGQSGGEQDHDEEDNDEEDHGGGGGDGESQDEHEDDADHEDTQGPVSIPRDPLKDLLSTLSEVVAETAQKVTEDARKEAVRQEAKANPRTRSGETRERHQAVEQKRADWSAQAEAVAAAEAMFAREVDIERFQGGVRVHTPTPQEHRLAKRTAAALTKLATVDRAVRRVRSELPPGRLDGREAMLRSAQQSLGMMPTARPFRQKRSRRVPDPPMRVGFIGDGSGSMKWSTRVLATTAWAFSNAMNYLDGDSAAVVFRERVVPLTRPGEVAKRVVEMPATAGGHNFRDAFRVIDGALNLTMGQGMRVLVVLSDGAYDAGQVTAARDAVARMVRNGGQVLWICLEGDKSRVPPGALEVRLPQEVGDGSLPDVVDGVPRGAELIPGLVVEALRRGKKR